MTSRITTASPIGSGRRTPQTSRATGRISPVMALASSLARYSTAATSWSSSTQRTLASFIWARLSAVFIVPGATAFTRTPPSRNSRARARVSPATAALAAMYDAIWLWGLSAAGDPARREFLRPLLHGGRGAIRDHELRARCAEPARHRVPDLPDAPHPRDESHLAAEIGRHRVQLFRGLTAATISSGGGAARWAKATVPFRCTT